VRIDDLKQLQDLASQFSLLNLPADKKILTEKIERSVASFAGNLRKQEAEYLFVMEDCENQQVVGSALILAKHGTEDVPHNYFKVVKKNRYSDDLGIGFIHQVLQFREETDGPTEIGGLLIDRSYRKRPEKLGKQISLMRFVYMGMRPERFEKRVLCELTPPLGDGGRSEFWEALGRRFTGLPYQEADLISQRNKEFIASLFPEEDIYMALLDAKARLVLGRVGEETRPAQHLLEAIGFKYLHEVDPFDGGPHYGANIEDIALLQRAGWYQVSGAEKANFNSRAFIGLERGGEFCGTVASCEISSEANTTEVALSPLALKQLQLEAGERIYLAKEFV
jgi:arginine N-succinyltransferase